MFASRFVDQQTAQALRLIGLVPELGADVVTLCSSTRDTDNMWRAIQETWPTMSGPTCGARWTTY